MWRNLCQIWVASTVKNRLELFEADLAIEADIVLYNDIVYLYGRNLHQTLAFKSFAEILTCNKVCVIDVKFFKQSPQLLIGQRLFDREYSSYELRVVDMAVADVVDLFDDGCDCLVLHVEVKFLEGSCQLAFANHAGFADVDCFELLAELFSTGSHFSCLVRVLLVAFDLSLADEKVHCCLFKL